MWARVWARFVGYDCQFFGLVSALIGVNWAIWLLRVDYSHEFFIDAPSYYRILPQLFPYWVLVSIFAIYGGGYVVAFLVNSWRGKRAALFLGGYLWCVLAYSTVLIEQFVPSVGVYAVLAVACWWSFVRMQPMGE